MHYVAPRELQGVYSCVDMFHTIDDPFTQQLLADYNAMFPDTQYRFTAGTACTGTYRGIKLYEQAMIATEGDLAQDASSRPIRWSTRRSASDPHAVAHVPRPHAVPGAGPGTGRNAECCDRTPDPAVRDPMLPFLEADVLVALLLVPQVTSDFHTIIASRMMLLAMLAISFDPCWGYSGIMTFGQALFFGSAGYVSALLANNVGFSQIWASCRSRCWSGWSGRS